MRVRFSEIALSTTGPAFGGRDRSCAAEGLLRSQNESTLAGEARSLCERSEQSLAETKSSGPTLL